MNNDEIISEEVKQLVIARLRTGHPQDKKMSIGSYGDFKREDLIMHVEKGDAIGKKVVEIELEFLQALKKGILK